VLDQPAETGIKVVESEETQEKAQLRAAAERQEPPERQPEVSGSNGNRAEPSWAAYGTVFEGCWDGIRWLSAGGVPCEPTRWMPMLIPTGPGSALKQRALSPEELRSPIKHRLVLLRIDREPGVRHVCALIIERNLFGTVPWCA
jgi:hypothetical protein